MKDILAWFQSLSMGWIVAMAVAGVAVFVGGSVMAYRTYDYIEHDNDFCMSCHLMAEPYELFGQSAHRDMGYKACHKPSFAGRTQMALTQVLEQPDSITHHAEVPNDKCASCHIEGNPEQWALVANSAGHRIHLESEDPELDGLMCVECHSSGIHEFAATDDTCAQSGCHTDVEVILGNMGNFAIHCAACHGFNAVVEEGTGLEAAQAAIAPSSDECLSCHVMRTLVDMPPDEPHEQVCATCHNPHEQETPAQAVETCASVGCHSDVQDLSPFHRGLDHAAVSDCSTCHVAHDFQVDGSDCLSCHQDIYDDETAPPPGTVIAASLSPHPLPGGTAGGSSGGPTGGPLAHFAGLGAGAGPAALLHLSPQVQETQERGPLISTGEVVFRHGNHREVECTECHTSEDRHGGLTLQSITDCRGCHHVAPVANDCASCHAPSVLNPEPMVAENWPMAFSTGTAVLRDVPFLHASHAGTDCATCHQDGLLRAPDVASCNSCHQEHHENPAAVDCMTCHEEPAESAHDMDSHLTCSGSGCHVDAPLQETPRTRMSCLSCHQDLTDHEPEQECIQCHTLPAPTRGGG